MKQATLNRFQKLGGKLQHASLGFPGGKGLFSSIQMAMKGNPEFINLTPNLKQILTDWCYIIYYMAKHPTDVAQLVHEYPWHIGYSDACGIGAR